MGNQTVEQVKKTVQALLNWLVPPTCLSCNRELSSSDTPICTECYQSLPFQHESCQQCGQPMYDSWEVCGRCIENAPGYDHCFCAFRYEAPVDACIRQFKYSQRPELAKPLAKLLSTELTTNGLTRPDLLIPVPVHRTRLKQRGFNQAGELARHLSRLLQIPYSETLVVKHRSTNPQAGLTYRQRLINQRGSFRVEMQTTVKHVAIIDDVVTTGSTASEIAKILKRNGVDYVQVWGVAHTK